MDNSNNDTLVTALLQKMVDEAVDQKLDSVVAELKDMVDLCLKEDLQRRLEYVERNYSLQKEYYDDWFKRYGNKLLKKAKEDFVWCRRSVGAHQTWQKRKDNKNLINGTARKKEQTDG